MASLLERWGVGGLDDRRFGTLSEGERKRAQIARALMTDPELLLLDEPLAGMDLGGREDLIQRLGRLAANPDAPATVLVTHHVEELPAGITHVLLLREGATVASGLARSVLTDDVVDQLADLIQMADDNLTAAFGLPIHVWRRSGRWFARAA